MKSKKYNDAYLRTRHNVDSLMQSPQIHGPVNLWKLIYLESIDDKLGQLIDIMKPEKDKEKK